MPVASGAMLVYCPDTVRDYVCIIPDTVKDYVEASCPMHQELYWCIMPDTPVATCVSSPMRWALRLYVLFPIQSGSMLMYHVDTADHSRILPESLGTVDRLADSPGTLGCRAAAQGKRVP